MKIFTFYDFRRRLPKKTSFKFQHEIRDQSFFHKMANKMKGGLNIKDENVKVENVKVENVKVENVKVENVKVEHVKAMLRPKMLRSKM